MSDSLQQNQDINFQESQLNQQHLLNSQSQQQSLEIQENKKSTGFSQNDIDNFRNQKCAKYVFLVGILSLAIQFYNYNMVGVLKYSIKIDLDINEMQFQFIVSLSEFISIPFAFISGIIFDKIGYSQGLIMSSSCFTFGIWITTFSAYFQSYYGILIGRTIYQTSLNISFGAYSSLLSKWYSEIELPQKQGYFEAAANLALLVQALLYPRLADVSEGIFVPILVGAIICTVFYLIGLIAPIIDIKIDNKNKQISQQNLQNSLQNNSSYMNDVQNTSQNMFNRKMFKNLSKFFWVNIICFVLFFVLDLIWISNQVSFLAEKFLLTEVQIGDLFSIASAMGLLSPFIGTFMKKVDRQEYFLIGSCISAILQYAYIFFHPQCEQPSFLNALPVTILYGLFLCMFILVLIPAVAINSPEGQTGMGYGIAYGLNYMGNAIMPIAVIGPILHYLNPMDAVLGVLIITIIALCFSIWWGKYEKIRRQQQENNSKYQEFD